MRIIIDGMGGDYAPREIVKGAVKAAREIDHEVILIGLEEKINECLKEQKWKGSNITVINATEVISNDEAPAMAVRKKKDSSISKGMRMLKEGDADVFISGGSTGALLSASLFTLGRIKGIKRPAIAAFFPKIGKNDNCLLLDCGANVESKPEYLLQNGIMGSIFLKNVKNIENPEVVMLNVGTEEKKGDELHKEAYALLKNSGINFKGNVEGRDIPFGVGDVVVADGFSGNIFLKTAEGMAMSILKEIRDKLMEGNLSKLGAILASGKLKELKKDFDYSEEGGAPILGIKGAVLKIHGSSKSYAVYKAILKSVTYVESDVTGQIEKSIMENEEL